MTNDNVYAFQISCVTVRIRFVNFACLLLDHVSPDVHKSLSKLSLTSNVRFVIRRQITLPINSYRVVYITISFRHKFD